MAGLTGKRGEGGVVRFPPSIPLIHSWIVKSGLLRVLYRINSLAILFSLTMSTKEDNVSVSKNALRSL